MRLTAVASFVFFAANATARNCSQIQTVLHSLDVNGDGIIANTELYSVAHFCGGSLNLDHGCNITELITACSQGSQRVKTHPVIRHTKASSLGNDVSWARSGSSCNSTSFRALLEANDANGDGLISNEEIPYITRLCPTAADGLDDSLDAACTIEELVEGHCSKSSEARRDATSQSCIKRIVCAKIKMIVTIKASDALVVREDGSSARMEELKVGDRVLAGYDNGQQIFEDIYMFGHELLDVQADFVHISFKYPVLSRLELTIDHFMPVFDDLGQLTYVRGGALRPGMLVSIGPELHAIQAVKIVTKRGLYNPYTLSGRIIVNGIQASSHSGSFLDQPFKLLGINTKYLPGTYQSLFSAARTAYYLLGKEKSAVVGKLLVNCVNHVLDLNSWPGMMANWPTLLSV
ncbi:hypothetical protein HDU83_008331 [Entophlyctis luteolus]|nr:hypothetical protein HDU83_008331 [Entophlyctis luteolus]